MAEAEVCGSVQEQGDRFYAGSIGDAMLVGVSEWGTLVIKVTYYSLTPVPSAGATGQAELTESQRIFLAKLAELI
jgi:hypothetical protein